MGKDYYDILRVPKEANDDEIKRAYKKMALLSHPDRETGSEAKFKEVSEAFEVLSDKNKRAIYDQVGEDGLKSGAPPPGAGFSGSSDFSGFPGFPGFPGFSSFSGVPGGATFTHTSSGSGQGFHPSDPNRIFERMFSGMGGGFMGSMGGHSDGGFGPSFDEDGFGPVRLGRPTRSPSLPDVVRPLEVSLEELYTGSTKRLRVHRNLSTGETEEKILEVVIQPGWKSGTKVRFPHASHERITGDAPDLVFEIKEKPHSKFTRDGDNLIIHLKVPLVRALTEEKISEAVTTLDNRTINAVSPPGVLKPGTETRIASEGMPIRRQHSRVKKGDLIVRWEVVFPDRLTPTQKEGIRKFLGS